MNMTTKVLRLRVHAQAFARAPVGYLQAALWRLRGLRLRSRHRFAALMGHAPDAYTLWIATREKALHQLFNVPARESLNICLVIDARDSDQGQSDTLRSLIVARDLAWPAGMNTPIWLLTNLGCDTVQIPAAGSVRLVDSGNLTDHLKRIRATANETGEHQFVLVTKAGDQVSPIALLAYSDAIRRHPGCTLFYADDDLIDGDGRRHSPHFKPSWNAELAEHHDFISGSCLFAAGTVPLAKGWPELANYDQRCEPRHVPLVLHHRRSRPAPRIPASAVLGAPAAAPNAGLPHVSVVIPTRNHSSLLRTCIAGLERTNYPSVDITVIDNGSDDRSTLSYLQELSSRGVHVLRDDGAFNFAALHNRAIPALRGPLLCLLNNDVEMLDEQWLSALARHAVRQDVGAVGARLLYPDRTIQHAGIIIGMGGGAGHAHRGEKMEGSGYFERSHLPQFVSAVTAACLVVEKAKYEAVGGFDEEAFAVAFNDVDLCLKLNAAGFQSFYEPGATLIHHESKSRGFDRRGKTKLRFAGELARLKERWGTDHHVDPFHHPELSRLSERFVVRL